MEHILRNLKLHYKEGLLSDDDYHNHMEKYHRRMDALRSALEREARQIGGALPLPKIEEAEEKPQKIIFEEALKRKEKKPKAQQKTKKKKPRKK